MDQGPPALGDGKANLTGYAAKDQTMTPGFNTLIQGLDLPDFRPDTSRLPQAMDRWVLDFLNHRDPSGRHLPLPLLFKRVTQFNTRAASRIIQDTIGRLETREKSIPPLPFCWISMGSDARGEQVIRTDQDNALIYADPPAGMEEEASAYFHALARGVTRGLDQLGFALCKGDVMATNPQWCRPLSQWLTGLDRWVGATEPEAVRKLTILLDFKAVFGEVRLAATLQNRVFLNFEKHPSASHFLVRDDQLFAPPKTRFNRIRTRRDKGCAKCFNLKTQALAHLVNGARLFAVNHGIRVPATLKRLERLGEDGVLDPGEARDYCRTFIFLTRLKLLTHLSPSPPGRPDNCIDISTLEPALVRRLDRALDQVTRFQKKMAAAYNQAWMNFFN